jgi:MFS family permease
MPDKKLLGLERSVFFTGLVSFFMDMGSEMIYPLVPIFLSSVLGVNKSIIGLIEGIAESTASLLKVFSGWFSDRIKKRKILMIAGYGISTLSRPILAIATLWSHVLGFRFIDRFGKGIRGAPRDAIIAESTLPKDLGRSFGFHRAMDTFGAVIGPAIAFIILSIFTGNYRLVFWLSMIPGIVAVLVIVFFIKETTSIARPHTPHPSPWSPTAPPEAGKPLPLGEREVVGDAFQRIRGEGTTSIPPPLTGGGKGEGGVKLFPMGKFDWRFKVFVAIATLFALGNSSDVFLILRATNIGVKESQIPLLYLSFNLIYSLVSIPAGILSDRIGRKRVILSGFILFAFVYWGFAVSSEKWHIWGLFLLYGVFMGLTEGIQKAYLSTVIPENLKATGYGIFSSFVGLAVLPASIIGGYLWDKYGPHATFYYGSLTAFASAVIFLVIFGLTKLKEDG